MLFTLSALQGARYSLFLITGEPGIDENDFIAQIAQRTAQRLVLVDLKSTTPRMTDAEFELLGQHTVRRLGGLQRMGVALPEAYYTGIVAAFAHASGMDLRISHAVESAQAWVADGILAPKADV